MPMILLIDDAPEVIELIKGGLPDEYGVDYAPTALEARRLLDSRNYDLILLDIELPDGDGFSLCAELQAQSATLSIPIIFLSGRTAPSDVAAALSLGAEDYVKKPFSPIELTARIKAKINSVRRAHESSGAIRFGNLRIVTAERAVYVSDQNGENRLWLSWTEFQLLYVLASHPERVYTRDELLERVWGTGVEVVDRTVDVHVSNLRKKLPSELEIKSVRGVGYSLTSVS